MKRHRSLKAIAAVLIWGILPANSFAAPQAAPIARSAVKAPGTPVVYDAYILGPGDALQIELLDLPELSGTFAIEPDGTLYLPRLRAIYVEGLTVEELRYFLTEQFKRYVRQPELFIRPVSYRPVRVYVGGEIQRPGFYQLSGTQQQAIELDLESAPEVASRRLKAKGVDASPTVNSSQSQQFSLASTRVPTLFDALRAARGITQFSNLAEVRVVRKQPLSSGGGKIQAKVNFLRLITNGDESVNIRLFDGDTIQVGRSPEVLIDQLLAASRTNLSPDFVEVFVSGRVKEPGPQSLPQGSTLNQAIASAGGSKLLKGKVEFLRFNREGGTDRRLFNYNPSAQAGDYKNPVLMAGDVVRINDSPLSATAEVMNEVSGPFVGVYSVYSLFKQ